MDAEILSGLDPDALFDNFLAFAKARTLHVRPKILF